MKDFVEASVQVIATVTGYHLPAEYTPYLIILAFVVPSMIPVCLAVRRWRGDFKAISGEMEAATKIISGETSKKLDVLVLKLSEHSISLEQSLSQRLDAIHSSLALTRELEEQPKDREIETESSETKVSPKTRLQLADAVRTSIIDKWIEGKEFKSLIEDSNCFEFLGENGPLEPVQIILSTPYRKAARTDGRLPYAVDIWVGGYKKLNFEWDSDGGYALRGFKRGDWIEDVAGWKLQKIKQSRRAA